MTDNELKFNILILNDIDLEKISYYITDPCNLYYTTSTCIIYSVIVYIVYRYILFLICFKVNTRISGACCKKLYNFYWY